MAGQSSFLEQIPRVSPMHARYNNESGAFVPCSSFRLQPEGGGIHHDA